MEQKHKKTFKYLIFMAIVGFITITNIPSASALPLIEIPTYTKGSCLPYGTDSTRAESKYRPYVSVPSHFPDEGYVTASINKGVFDVYVYEIIDGTSHNPTPLQHHVLGGTHSKSHKITYQVYNEPKDYAIIFLLKQSDDLCEVNPTTTTPKQNDDGSWTTSDGNGFIYYYYLGVPSRPTNTLINNVNYNGICAAWRTGNYAQYQSVFAEVGLTQEEFNEYWNRINFPYCTNQRVYYNYSKKDTAQIIKNKIIGVKIEDDYREIQQQMTGPAEGAIITDNTNLSNSPIQCPAYKNVNGVTTPNQTYTTQKYYHKSVVKEEDINIYTTTGNNIDGICKQTCEENVTVTYGPPVASKAGLCFEYKVKVESKVNCETEFTAAQPEPEDYEICTPVGSCNGGAYHSASGPNDEFDSCVSSCDGGKYTQKCIDKCYEEVYGEQDAKLPLNYIDNVSVQQMKYNENNINDLDPELKAYYDRIIASGSDAVGPGKTYSTEELQIAITEAGTGYYTVEGGSIKWKSGDGRYWELPGRYYTLNIPNYTITRLQDVGRCNSSFIIGGKKQCGISLIDTTIGILRNNAGTSYCGAACSWYGCSAARSNGYYTNANKKATNRQFLNSADAIEVYKKEFNKYKAAAIECKAKATCTTNTAEFTIKVNNKTNTEPDNNNWITYKQSINEYGNKTGTTVNGDNIGTDIILDSSGCYTNAENKSQTEYMTEWSFPGTWINNKTGKISYKPQTDNAWHLKKEKFCTNLDSKYVNETWWNHRVKQPTTNFPPEAQAIIDEYNILATARDFGYFEWNFDVQCFYAMYDSEAGTSNHKISDLNPLAYQARTVDLVDLFPNNEDETQIKDPSSTGRTQGFNWTNEATNLKNSEYEITPGALYTEVQTRGTEIYDPKNNEQYLDYEFYLTPSDLNKIRNYNKTVKVNNAEAGEIDNSGNFGVFDGEIKVSNGVAYYESNLFRNGGPLNSSSVIALGALGVNNQSGRGSNTAERFNNEYVSSMLALRDNYYSNIAGGNINE